MGGRREVAEVVIVERRRNVKGGGEAVLVFGEGAGDVIIGIGIGWERSAVWWVRFVLLGCFSEGLREEFCCVEGLWCCWECCCA